MKQVGAQFIGTFPRVPGGNAGLLLRRLAAGDLDAFQGYRHDPEVGRYQGWLPLPRDEASAFLSGMSAAPFCEPGRWFQIGVAKADTGALIGDIGVCVSADADHAEMGITIARPWQGQGLATAALRETIAMLFECTPVSRILAVTDERNLPARRALGRAGMRHVETVDATFRGEACRELLFAVAREPA